MLSRSQVSANLGKFVAILGLALGLEWALWLALISARYVYTTCFISLVVICGIYLGLRQRFLKADLPSLEAKPLERRSLTIPSSVIKEFINSRMTQTRLLLSKDSPRFMTAALSVGLPDKHMEQDKWIRKLRLA